MTDFLRMEPQRYWQPDAEQGIEDDIIENPAKYEQYIAARKMDGEWACVIWDGNEVIIRSRSISKKTNEYARKEESLPHLVNVFKQLPANTVLLGELCYDDLYKRSKDVGCILRSLPALALEKQTKDENKLNFYCFDVLEWAGEELMDHTLEQRISYISVFEEYMENNKIDGSHIRYAVYNNIYEVVAAYQDYLAKGGEGFVLQKKTSLYTPGKRPAWQSIKLKKCTQEIELPVVGTIDPEREYTGKELENWTYFENGQAVTKYYYKGWKAGIIVNNNGTLCNVASGITDEDAEWLTTDYAKKLIAEGTLYASVSAMEIEPETGKLRHGRLLRFREDM